MTVVEWLQELGGVATRGTLLRLVTRSELDRVVASGDVLRLARGRYALPDADEGVRAAAALGGVLSVTSAALHHGWAVRSVPDRPHVTVARGRRIPPALQRSVHLHRADITPHHVAAGVTDEPTTLLDCLRQLPRVDALCVADSALRAGVGRSLLDRIAEEARGPGSPQVRWVAARASHLAANPFESALRDIAFDVPGLGVEPQVVIREDGLTVRPDLVDVRLRIVCEADSFEWHGKRSALRADARRYDLLVVRGWVVLRFAWRT